MGRRRQRGGWTFPMHARPHDTTSTSAVGDRRRRRRPRGVAGWSTARNWLRRLVFVVRTRLISLLFEEQDPKLKRLRASQPLVRKHAWRFYCGPCERVLCAFLYKKNRLCLAQIPGLRQQKISWCGVAVRPAATQGGGGASHDQRLACAAH